MSRYTPTQKGMILMFGFIFILISAVTNEVKAAHIAQHIADRIPENRYTRNIKLTIESWIYLVFRACQDCGMPVIDESHSAIHDACLEELRRFNKREQELETQEDANPDLPTSEGLKASMGEPRWFDHLEEEDPFKDQGCGHCLRCRHGLTESEWAIGDYCDSCRPVILEEWEAQQEAKAEAAEEARRYPEVSDDDDGYCPDCDRQLGDCRC